MRLARVLPIPSLLVTIFLLTGSSVADAQGTRTLNTVERRLDTMDRQSKDFERDSMGREANKKNDPETAKRSRQIKIEIEEDLHALQGAYNNTVTALQNTTEIRPGVAVETGKSVRKHALRLKANLALPEADDKEEKTVLPTLPDTDRKSLTALCRVIYELITNPMFEGTVALDVKNGTKARLDLDAIIRLSEHLSNASETASK